MDDSSRKTKKTRISILDKTKNVQSSQKKTTQQSSRKQKIPSNFFKNSSNQFKIWLSSKKFTIYDTNTNPSKLFLTRESHVSRAGAFNRVIKKKIDTLKKYKENEEDYLGAMILEGNSELIYELAKLYNSEANNLYKLRTLLEDNKTSYNLDKLRTLLEDNKTSYNLDKLRSLLEDNKTSDNIDKLRSVLDLEVTKISYTIKLYKYYAFEYHNMFFNINENKNEKFNYLKKLIKINIEEFRLINEEDIVLIDDYLHSEPIKNNLIGSLEYIISYYTFCINSPSEYDFINFKISNVNNITLLIYCKYVLWYYQTDRLNSVIDISDIKNIIINNENYKPILHLIDIRKLRISSKKQLFLYKIKAIEIISDYKTYINGGSKLL